MSNCHYFQDLHHHHWQNGQEHHFMGNKKCVHSKYGKYKKLNLSQDACEDTNQHVIKSQIYKKYKH